LHHHRVFFQTLSVSLFVRTSDIMDKLQQCCRRLKRLSVVVCRVL